MDSLLKNKLLNFDHEPDVRLLLLYARSKDISTAFRGNLMVWEAAIDERVHAIEAIRERMKLEGRDPASYEMLSAETALEKTAELRAYSKLPVMKLEEFSYSFDRYRILLIKERSPDFAARYIHGEAFSSVVLELRELYSNLLVDERVDKKAYAYHQKVMPLQELVDELDVMALFGVKDFEPPQSLAVRGATN